MKRYAGQGPGPYGSSVVVPTQMRTLPWAFVRAHAFPKQDLREFYAAAENMRQHEIMANAIFMPREAYMHPYSHPQTGVAALSAAQQRMAALQRQVLDKHVRGIPLNARAARECLAMRMPAQVSTRGYQKIQAMRARAAGAPALNAHQISRYTPTDMPQAVFQKRMSYYLPFGGTINPRSIVSRDRSVASVVPNRVQNVLSYLWRR